MNLFRPVQKVLCPYCMCEIRSRDTISKCPSCKTVLPVQYVQEYNEAYPFFVQLIGWSRVGKTVYLQALTLTLMKMSRFWRNHYSFAPLTQETLDYVRNVNEFLSSGSMPAPTQLEIQQAYIMILKGMERWGGRTIVTRDVAGEFFNDFEFPIKYTPYLLNVPVTMMMVSLSDLENQAGKTMDQLMQSFIQTMATHDPKYKSHNRKLVVILSKADLFYNRLPSDIQRYIQNDPLAETFQEGMQGATPWNSETMQCYMDEMSKTSQSLNHWISDYTAGYNLISLAHDKNFQVEFTIVSSTGGEVKDGVLSINMQPRRVLDPYFWALDFQSKP